MEKLKDYSFQLNCGKFILSPVFVKAIISDSLNSENNTGKLGWQKQEK